MAAKKMFEISHMPVVLMGIAFLCSAIGVGTDFWQGGFLFATQNLHWEQFCGAVGSLIVVGSIGLGLSFFLGIYLTKYPETIGPLLLGFYIALYVGTLALSVATLIFTTMINNTWSYLLAIIACVLACLVVWVDLSMLRTIYMPFEDRRQTVNQV